MKLDRVTGVPTPRELHDSEWLASQYITQKRSTTDIGRELNCAPGTVRQWLVHHGIPRRSPGSEKGHTRTSDVTRQKQSLARRGLLIGARNPNWRGGVALKDPDRNRYRSKMWVKAVKDRDGWKCVECGSSDRLHAHHIKRWRDYPELRYEISNGTTLCHDCHEAAHGRGFKFRWPHKAERPTSASAP